MTVGAAMAEPPGKGEFETFYVGQLPRMLRYCAMLGLSLYAAQDVILWRSIIGSGLVRVQAGIIAE
jgi:hypothetical protein